MDLPIKKALDWTKCKALYQSLHERVLRYRSNYRANALKQTAASSLLSHLDTSAFQETFYPVSLSGKRKDPPEDLGAPDAVHPISLSGKRNDPLEDLGVVGSIFSLQAMGINMRLIAMNAAIE